MLPIKYSPIHGFPRDLVLNFLFVFRINSSTYNLLYSPGNFGVRNETICKVFHSITPKKAVHVFDVVTDVSVI